MIIYKSAYTDYTVWAKNILGNYSDSTSDYAKHTIIKSILKVNKQVNSPLHVHFRI